MLTFISLLYYKNSTNHVKKLLKIEKSNKNVLEFLKCDLDLESGNSLQQKYEIDSIKFGRRSYTKRLVNKWHLMVLLVNNPILIIERKQNLTVFSSSHTKISLFEKAFDVFKCYCKSSENKSNEISKKSLEND